jgi:hypothetical protein
MTDFNSLSPSSISDPDETHAYSTPSNLTCTSTVSSTTNSERNIDPVEIDSTYHAYAIPWTCARSDTSPFSSCGSLSIFDDQSNGSLADSYTISSHHHSDGAATQDDRCSAPSFSSSSAASVVASISSSGSYTLVEGTSSENGSFSQPPISDERYTGLSTVASDDADEWSDDDTITIGQLDYSQAESAQLPIIAVPASSPRESIAAEVKMHINEKLGRYATQEYSFEVGQPTNHGSHSPEYHLEHLGRQRFRQRYLVEDPAETPWTMFHLRVSSPPPVVMTEH